MSRDTPTCLETVLQHDRGVMLIVLLAIPLASWSWIVLMARDMYGSMQGASAWMMTPVWTWPDLLLLWAMWAVMMTAMMLPTAAPLFLIYATATRRQPGAGNPAPRIYALAAGYLVVWSLFSIGATALQRILSNALVLTPMMEPATPLAGAVVLADRYIYTAFARDVVRGVSPKWVRELYAFAVKPTVAFYFRTPLDVAMKRILGGRDAIKYYEAGMDLGLSDDIEESFRIFQARIIDEYEKMVEEFNLVPVDATRSIEEQQAEVRRIVSDSLTGTKKTRIRRWVDLASLAKGSRV